VSRSSDVVGGLSDHEIQPADDLEPTHPPFFGLLQQGPLGVLLLLRLPGFMYVLNEILHLRAPLHEITGFPFGNVVGLAVVRLDDFGRDVIPLCLLPAIGHSSRSTYLMVELVPRDILPELRVASQL